MITVLKKDFLLFLLRVSMGWLLFYAGITKLFNPQWSAGGYLQNAKTLSGFYQWLATPEMLPITNFLNEWGLTLLGVALLLGVFVRWAGILGAALMLLYYFPILEFPYAGEHSYIVDDHIIYALVLLVLGASGAGKILGLGKKFPRLA